MAYKMDYLTDVILRLDFSVNHDDIKTELKTDIQSVIVNYFPIPEKRSVELQQVISSANDPDKKELTIKSEKVIEWHYFGKNREKELVITSNYIYILIKKYQSFEILKKQFFDIVAALAKVYNDIKFNRIGLRYIDQIDLINDRTSRKNWHTYWSKYINSSLTSGLAFLDNDEKMSRYLNSIEMNYGDFMLHFQYGISNPDYPASNKKQIFILDTDVYSIGLYSISDVTTVIGQYHEVAKDWFERSIKDNLREKMGIINGHE